MQVGLLSVHAEEWQIMKPQFGEIGRKYFLAMLHYFLAMLHYCYFRSGDKPSNIINNDLKCLP